MGASEMLLGKALKQSGLRDKFLIQTKCSLNWRPDGGNFHYAQDDYTVYNNTSADAVRKDVEGSLQRLQTDYIDILIVHDVCKTWPVAETMEAMLSLVKEGKVRALGISNSHSDDLDEYCQYGDIALVQEQFSMLAPDHGRAYFPTAAAHHAAYQVYGALEEGFLTAPDFVDRTFKDGDFRNVLPWTKEPHKSAVRQLFDVMKPLTEKYECSYANLVQAWTLKQFPNLNLLIGFRHKETLEDTCRVFDIDLTVDDAQLLTKAAIPAQVRGDFKK